MFRKADIISKRQSFGQILPGYISPVTKMAGSEMSVNQLLRERRQPSWHWSPIRSTHCSRIA